MEPSHDQPVQDQPPPHLPQDRPHRCGHDRRRHRDAATGRGRQLHLDSGGHNVDNTGGVINIGNGSVANQFGSSISGGTINTTGSGALVAFNSGSNFLNAVTLNGTLDMSGKGYPFSSARLTIAEWARSSQLQVRTTRGRGVNFKTGLPATKRARSTSSS